MVIELDLASCCVESNGQEEDGETDIGDVLRFDNANFSSPQSFNRSLQKNPQFMQNDHNRNKENTCQPNVPTFNQDIVVNTSLNSNL